MSSLETLQKQDRDKISGEDKSRQQQESASAGRRRKVVLFEASIDEQNGAEDAGEVARERKRRRARRAR